MSRRTSPRGYVVAACAAVAVVIAGCGGSTPPRPALPLGAYVIRAGEDPGFRFTGSAKTFTAVAAFDLGDPRGQTAVTQLRSAGFRRAVAQPTGSLHGEGVSTVIELGSPRAAERLLASGYARTVPEVGAAVDHRFAVPGVPNAVASSIEITPGNHAANVWFREGRCVLIVGDAISGSGYEQPLAAAARAIYERTNRRRGVCTT